MNQWKFIFVATFLFKFSNKSARRPLLHFAVRLSFLLSSELLSSTRTLSQNGNSSFQSKLSRVTSGYGGLMIPLSRVGLSQKRLGYHRCSVKNAEFGEKLGPSKIRTISEKMDLGPKKLHFWPKILHSSFHSRNENASQHHACKWWKFKYKSKFTRGIWLWHSRCNLLVACQVNGKIWQNIFKEPHK